MSCQDLEKLFVSGAPESMAAAHRRTCLECAHLGRDVDEARGLAEGLSAPVWSYALRASLYEIPRRTVDCEGAEPLLAAALEGDAEIPAADRARLDNHLSRCGACTSAANVLLTMRDLEAPAPPPWLATRLSAARPKRPVSPWRRLLSGRAFVVYAYAAALLVMVMGWNPTNVVRNAGFANLSVSTRHAVTVAQSSLTDRLGALQEKAARRVAVWKGHIGGYGRAVVSNAIAIVSRPETKKTPTKPRLGKEGNASSAEGFETVRSANREPFALRFRV